MKPWGCFVLLYVYNLALSVHQYVLSPAMLESSLAAPTEEQTKYASDILFHIPSIGRQKAVQETNSLKAYR